ncbi:MAG: hypothetical protein K6G94_00115, partial [Kiritimatiellae bacterium]|nr:hypothetical protein [Kiritimatiellia bacterium]
YVTLSILGTLGAMVAACCNNNGVLTSLLVILLGGSFPIAMSFGMVLSLRRGRRVWFIMPNSIVLFLCLIVSVGVLCESMSAGALAFGLVALLLFAGPIVLLNLSVSTRWFKAKAKDGRPDALGCLGVFLLLVLFLGAGLIAPSIFICLTFGLRHAQSQMAMRGRNLNISMIENQLAHESGEDWIDPASFSNSTQFVQALWAKLGEDKAPCPYPDSWCIAVNPPDNDKFPVMVTANIDPRELLCSQDKDQPLKLTCPKEWGGTCFKVCEKVGVIVYKGGASQIFKNKYVRPSLIFNDGIPKPGPDTYFLTPTGRVDFVERQAAVSL